MGDPAVDALRLRLNRPGQDRLAAVWEVVLLQAFAGLGEVAHEKPLPSGRCPDLRFRGAAEFTADIACVSDEGLDEENPVHELMRLLEGLKTRLGLPAGGMQLTVSGKDRHLSRGARTVLRIPPRKELREFVRTRIEPELRRQMRENAGAIRLDIEDEDHALGIAIDPRRSPINTGSYPSYDNPTIRDSNPLFNVLKSKARQLRGSEGLTGIIVCDGGSAALSQASGFWSGVSTADIVRHFLRQHRSIHFVLALTIGREAQRTPHKRPALILDALYVKGESDLLTPDLDSVVKLMLAALPRPVSTAINAAQMARSKGYGLGHHGGHVMSDGRLRMSSRELMEVLAGRRTVEQMDEANGWTGAGRPNPFERFLAGGRLPRQITVTSGEDDPDDWIEIEFGDPDPAITPFR